MKRTIYSTEITDELYNDCKEQLLDEGIDDPTPDAITAYAYQRLDDDWQWLKENTTFDVNDEIIAVGEIGRWNGTFLAYKIVGTNVSEIFNLPSDCEDGEWYWDENKDICMTAYHHDGRYNIRFRKFKTNVSEKKRYELLDAIYNQDRETADELIAQYTMRISSSILRMF